MIHMMHEVPLGLAVEIYHPWNHERRIFEIETILSEHKISFRWHVNGVYDLDLRSNTISARSSTAKRRNFCLWKAVDILSVRKAVYAKLHPETVKRKEILAKAIKVENMPFQKAKVLP